jgi:hypothetical protein
MKGPRLCAGCKAPREIGWQKWCCPFHGDLSTLMTVVTIKGHRDKFYQPVRSDACKTKYRTNKAFAAAGRTNEDRAVG